MRVDSEGGGGSGDPQLSESQSSYARNQEPAIVVELAPEPVAEHQVHISVHDEDSSQPGGSATAKVPALPREQENPDAKAVTTQMVKGQQSQQADLHAGDLSTLQLPGGGHAEDGAARSMATTESCRRPTPDQAASSAMQKQYASQG